MCKPKSLAAFHNENRSPKTDGQRKTRERAEKVDIFDQPMYHTFSVMVEDILNRTSLGALKPEPGQRHAKLPLCVDFFNGTCKSSTCPRAHVQRPKVEAERDQLMQRLRAQQSQWQAWPESVAFAVAASPADWKALLSLAEARVRQPAARERIQKALACNLQWPKGAADAEHDPLPEAVPGQLFIGNLQPKPARKDLKTALRTTFGAYGPIRSMSIHPGGECQGSFIHYDCSQNAVLAQVLNETESDLVADGLLLKVGPPENPKALKQDHDARLRRVLRKHALEFTAALLKMEEPAKRTMHICRNFLHGKCHAGIQCQQVHVRPEKLCAPQPEHSVARPETPKQIMSPMSWATLPVSPPILRASSGPNTPESVSSSSSSTGSRRDSAASSQASTPRSLDTGSAASDKSVDSGSSLLLSPTPLMEDFMAQNKAILPWSQLELHLRTQPCRPSAACGSGGGILRCAPAPLV
eukprot:NODE_742_length_1671_cov_43.160622_g732_i0.p1 GENE.NODE_742_length_1671_cov_43.160622_g732_i0~~NODE_742_length_1671_cov_43.160622_g732_i0.p1  ORF type:complete len:469 (+),score=36.47 NODE_742_length_1671_cov_43.160622_g732_i0:101-1507(+)